MKRISLSIVFGLCFVFSHFTHAKSNEKINSPHKKAATINVIGFSGIVSQTQPTTSATAPSADASDVVSLFSDSYANNHGVSTWRTDWSVSVDHETHSNTTGDTSQKYTFNGNSYAGIDLASPYLDASNTATMHLDVWSADKSTFLLKVVDFGADGIYSPAADGGDDTWHVTSIDIPNASTWNTISIPLSSMTGLGATSSIAQFVVETNNTISGTIFLDNIYFESAPAPVTSPSTSATAPSADASDVVSLFSDSYANNHGVSTWRTDWSVSVDHETNNTISGTIFLDNIYFESAPAPVTSPSTSATAPSADASDVVSLFSDSYTQIQLVILLKNTLSMVIVMQESIWLRLI